MKTVLVVLAMTTGCYVRAVTETSTVTRDTMVVSEGAAGATGLRVLAGGGEVMVAAAAERACVAERFATTAYTTDKHVEVIGLLEGDPGEGGDGSDRAIGLYGAVLMGAIVAPVALAVGIVTGVVAGVQVAIARPETTTGEPVKLDEVAYACDAPVAGVAVTVTMPSGRIVEAVTGDDGVAVVEVRGEPLGEVTARGGGVTASATYYPDRAACVAARATDRGVRCEPTTAREAQIEAAWGALRAATDGDCEAAVRAGGRVKADAPSVFFEVIGDDPVYAACFAEVSRGP